MKRTFPIVLASVAAVVFLVGAWTHAGPPQGGALPRGRWEYRTMTRAQVLKVSDNAGLMASLNKLGDEGWELVAVDGLSSEAIFEVAVREKIEQARTEAEKDQIRKLPIASTFFFKRQK